MKTKRAKQSLSSRLNSDNTAARGERRSQQVLFDNKLHLAARQSSPSFADFLFCFVSCFLLATLTHTSAELDLIKITTKK